MGIRWLWEAQAKLTKWTQAFGLMTQELPATCLTTLKACPIKSRLAFALCCGNGQRPKAKFIGHRNRASGGSREAGHIKLTGELGAGRKHYLLSRSIPMILKENLNIESTKPMNNKIRYLMALHHCLWTPK